MKPMTWLRSFAIGQLKFQLHYLRWPLRFPRRGLAGDRLLVRLGEKPDLTMRALAAEQVARGVKVAHDAVWRFARRAAQTVRKDPDGGRADAPERGAVPRALEGAAAPARSRAPDLHRG